MTQLAIHGGKPVRGEPIARSGERFGDEEIRLLTEVVRSQKLNCNCGTRVKEFAQSFADYMGMTHGVMVTSGTAAIHCALGAVDLNPGEAGETIHHLFMAKLKRYITDDTYRSCRARYKECIRMLNGLEKSIERHLPKKDHRWEVAEEPAEYGDAREFSPSGCHVLVPGCQGRHPVALAFRAARPPRQGTALGQ